LLDPHTPPSSSSRGRPLAQQGIPGPPTARPQVPARHRVPIPRVPARVLARHGTCAPRVPVRHASPSVSGRVPKFRHDTRFWARRVPVRRALAGRVPKFRHDARFRALTRPASWPGGATPPRVGTPQVPARRAPDSRVPT